jgi:hypothetical protein
VLSFDATTEPPAFHVSPLDSPGDRPLWIIWARQGDELRLAFYDGIDGRPEDFGPRRKLVVLTLVPARAGDTAPALDPCDVLRGAGVDGLLGGPAQARPAPGLRPRPLRSPALRSGDGSRPGRPVGRGQGGVSLGLRGGSELVRARGAGAAGLDPG